MDHEISGGMVRDHSDRLKGMERELADLRSKVSSMGTELELVKEGVANFRAFQRDNREFMGWFKAHEQRRQEKEQEDKEAREKKETAERKKQEDKDKARARLHYWWLGILSALIVGGVLGTAGWIMNFMKDHHISANTSSVTEPEQLHAKEP